LSPVIFYGKVFLQKLWVLNLPWDCLWPTWNLSDITPDIFSQGDSEVKGQKSLIEISNVAGVDKYGESSLLGINEKNFLSLRRLLSVCA